jgi:hypothetical protein
MERYESVDNHSFDEVPIQWFAWRQVQEALAHGRRGGIALHYFRWDLRRFGLAANEPACHILSSDRLALSAFSSQFGLPWFLIKAPRPHRPEIWHFDAFGPVLERLARAHPPPDDIDKG